MRYTLFLERYPWVDDVFFYDGVLMCSETYYIGKPFEVEALLVRVKNVYIEIYWAGESYRCIRFDKRNEVEKMLELLDSRTLRSHINWTMGAVEAAMDEVRMSMEAYDDFL